MDESSENPRLNVGETNDGTHRHGKSKSSWGISSAVHAVHGVGFVAKKVVNNRLTDSLWHSKKSGSSHSHETVDHHASQPSLNVADDQTQDGSHDCTPGSDVGERSENTKPSDGSHDSTTGSTVVDRSENTKASDGSHAVKQHRWHGTVVGSSVLNKLNHAYEASKVPNLKRKSFPHSDSKPLPESSTDASNVASTGVNPSLASTKGAKTSPIVRGASLTPATKSVSDTTTTSTIHPSTGVSPSPAATTEASSVSPTPSREVGHRARDVSPTSVKPSKPSSRRHFFSANILSVFTKAVDNRKEKNLENPKEVAQHLELLYNIQVQWQFANASAEAALDLQRTTAEKSLFDMWRAIVDLRDSLASKKINIVLLILQLKIYTVIYRQMGYIDEWASIQKEHGTALFATTNDLQARSLSVPLTGGVKADIKGLKLVIFSTIQVLQATVLCIQSTISKLDKTHFLASELANLVLHERALLDECEILLASAAPLHIEECSLRSFLLQYNRTSMTE